MSGECQERRFPSITVRKSTSSVIGTEKRKGKSTSSVDFPGKSRKTNVSEIKETEGSLKTYINGPGPIKLRTGIQSKN